MKKLSFFSGKSEKEKTNVTKSASGREKGKKLGLGSEKLKSSAKPKFFGGKPKIVFKNSFS